jgi:hypothetical protein
MLISPNSSTFSGLAFWLIPTLVDEHTILQEEMDSIRQANSSVASAAFLPHATLIAGLQTEKGWDAKTAWSAFEEGFALWKKSTNIHGPIECNLDELTTRGTYFQVSTDRWTLSSAGRISV